MSKLLYLIFFVSSALSLRQAVAQPTSSIDLLDQAQQYFSARQYDSSAYFAEQALESYTKPTEQAWAYYHLGRAQRRLDQITKATEQLTSAIRITQDSSLKVRAHYEMGKCYSNAIQPELAIYHYERALLFSPAPIDLVRIYEGIADEHNYYYSNHTDAEIFYEKALGYLQTLTDEHRALLLRLLYNLAATHQQRQDYFTALDYAQQATQLARETQSINLDICYSLLGTIYQQLGRYPEAIEAYQNAIQQVISYHGSDNPDLARYYNNLGLLYSDLGLLYSDEEQYQIAIEYYEQGRAIAALDHYPLAPSDLADSYQYLGNAHTRLRDFPRAYLFLEQAWQQKKQFFGDQHPEVARALEGLSRYYQEQGKLDTAIYFQQQVLIIKIPDFTATDPLQNPSWEQVQEYTLSFVSLHRKAELLHQRYYQSKQPDDLKRAVAIFLLADSLMHTHRISYEYENSQLHLLEEQKRVYEMALTSCYLLYQTTQDEQYLRHALYFMERSKAVILWDVLRDITHRSSLGVSDSLQQEERALKAQLTKVINDITELRRQPQFDEMTLDSLQQRRFLLHRQQLHQQEELRTAYPNYVQLKYASPMLPYASIQQLVSEEQSIIEFFWGYEFVYVFSLSPDQWQLHRLPVSDSLIQSIERLQQLLQKGPSSRNYLTEARQYTTIGHDLYEQLITPAFPTEKSLPSFLTIIPDGPLAYLPFDALLTRPELLSDEPDFRQLPYLLQRSAVQYSPSLQVLISSQANESQSSANLRTLAFGFTNQFPNTATSSNSSELVALPGTFKEIRAIGRFTSAQLLAGPDASETRFKQDAESYQILHLALHGLADSANANNNVIFFPSTADSVNDGQLYSFELYDLQLTNTKLAVLSACETGIGSWKAGEGVYSMGRGFAYAGCPSVIMSLWKINDAFTARIMPTLYRSLYRGERVDKALQEAKLKYIRKAGRYQTHPSYWAAFVLQGEFTPIVQHQNTYEVAIAIILISIVYFGVMFFRKKKAG
ncbi:MAG: CHAT domain-containing tetratricopeptide repeat protein [Bacteroidota bacterium]